MEDVFKIFVRRLEEGQIEAIKETVASDFMDIHEAELAFHLPVQIQGQAAVTEGTLILTLRVETEATMPCRVCNGNVQVKILINDFCHTEALSEIKSGIFDFKEVLRESILLELPLTTECQGRCPEREVLAHYFTSSKKEFNSL